MGTLSECYNTRRSEKANRFFRSCPAIFLKDGKVDLNRVRCHILGCIAALRCFEHYSAPPHGLEKSFYLVLSDVASALSDLRDVPDVLSTSFLLETFLPIDSESGDTDKIIQSQDQYRKEQEDWKPVHWRLISSSFTNDQQLAAIDYARGKSDLSTTRCKALLLHYAAASPNASIDVAEAVASPSAARCKDANGRVPLHWAAMHSRSLEMLDFLLAEWPGATRAQDKDGYTPLHHLITRRKFPERVAMIVRLVDADPGSCGLVTTEKALTALSLFCDKLGESTADDCKKLFTKLYAAHPAAVSQRNRHGNTPLHTLCYRMVAMESQLAVAQSLLTVYKEGASIKNINDWLPAHYAACFLRSTHMLELLLDAYPEALSREGNSVNNILSIATLSYNSEVQKYILERSPELVCVADSNGKLPLHKAINHCDHIWFERLYTAYPDAIKAFTNNGFLPLHCALSKLVDDPMSLEADIIRSLLARYPAAVNMRQLPGAVGAAATNIQTNFTLNGGLDVFVDEYATMVLTPYQLSRHTSCEYIQRILLRACPEADNDPQRLRDMNYAARRQLMFLAFAACTDRRKRAPAAESCGSSSGSSSSSATTAGTSEGGPQEGRASCAVTSSAGGGSAAVGGARFVHHLRRLMDIGDDNKGLLIHIASFL